MSEQWNTDVENKRSREAARIRKQRFDARKKSVIYIKKLTHLAKKSDTKSIDFVKVFRSEEWEDLYDAVYFKKSTPQDDLRRVLTIPVAKDLSGRTVKSCWKHVLGVLSQYRSDKDIRHISIEQLSLGGKCEGGSHPYRGMIWRIWFSLYTDNN
jgi:hypothetical protein